MEKVIEDLLRIELNDIAQNQLNNTTMFSNQCQESLQIMRSTLFEFAERINKILTPVSEIATRIQNSIGKYLLVFAELIKPLRVIGILADNQYVIWEGLDDEFVEEIITSPNINKTLRQYHERDHYKSINEIAQKCALNPIIKQNKRVFAQSLEAFNKGKSDLAVIGLTATIDGVLSNASGKCMTSIPKRTQELVNKLENAEALLNEEYALLSLYYTLDQTSKLFSERIQFFNNEPKRLNRHWIMHGRSSRKKTKLDCVKLIRLLYGIIVINDMTEKN